VAYDHPEPMRVFFMVSAPLMWLDEAGNTTGYFDVHDYIKARTITTRSASALNTSPSFFADPMTAASEELWETMRSRAATRRPSPIGAR